VPRGVAVKPNGRFLRHVSVKIERSFNIVSSAGSARKGAATACRPGASEWRIGDASTGARNTPAAASPASASHGPRRGGTR
jgi:hypothetical protein